jgi:hypothetical protein
MSHKKQFSDQVINDLFSKLEISLEKDKDLVWSEKFEDLVKEDAVVPSKKRTFFKLYWQYGIAASFFLLLASTFYFSFQSTVLEEPNLLEIAPNTQQDLLADQTMIESLFVEDKEFDEWFEEQYILSSVN